MLLTNVSFIDADGTDIFWSCVGSPAVVFYKRKLLRNGDFRKKTCFARRKSNFFVMWNATKLS